MKEGTLEIRLLGDIEVLLGGEAVSIGGRQPRLALAAMALASPEAVSLEGLIDCLWDEPPASAVKTVRSVVSRVRSAMPGDSVESAAHGYRLRVPRDAIDAHRLVEAARRSAAAVTDGDSDEVVATALSHSGEPLGSYHLSSRLAAEKQRLVEVQMGLRDWVAERWIQSGDYGRALPFAEELVAENSLAENRWALLVQALAGVGRRGEALRAVQRMRLVLGRELGVEPGPRFRDLEQTVLRGGESGTHLAEVPERSATPPRERTPGNLPSRGSGLVGRDIELMKLRDTLAPGRVVTVVGTGGVGKTSLAIESAWDLAGGLDHGVWFCDLAAVSGPAAVPRAVAASLQVTQQEGVGPTESIVESLRASRALVIIDNCEHVIDAVAALARALLDGCPDLSLMATSRERLGVSGEHVMAIGPLDPHGDGVELFTIRAREAQPGFDPAAHREPIAELCERLDGLPLAIELAAARAPAVAPRDLLAHIEDRFRLLRGSRRDVHDRQRTLWNTVEWSHQLLSSDAADLFDRLSVFVGDFDLDAAIAVCATDGLAAADVVDGMGELVDRSLVIAHADGEGSRYRLLETLREFGANQLERGNATAHFSQRHCEHYARVARGAQVSYEGPDCLDGVAAFESAWSNIRAASRWAIDTGDQQLQRDLIEAPAWFASLSRLDEVGDWAADANSRSPSALFAGIAATFAFYAGQYRHAIEVATAGVATAPTATHCDTVFCHWALEVASMHAGQPDPCVEHMNNHEVAATAANDLFGLAVCHAARVIWAASTQPHNGLPYAEAAQAAAADVGSPALDAMVEVYLAGLYQARGELEEAAHHRETALALAKLTNNRSAASLALAWRSVRAPAPERDRTYRDTLVELRDTHDWMATQVVLESLAAHLLDRAPRHAAHLVGYLEDNQIGHGGLLNRRRQTLAEINSWPHGPDWLNESKTSQRAELLDQSIDVLNALLASDISIEMSTRQ